MKTAIIIPARMKSTRLPAKPLIELAGANGKKRSLIERAYIAAAEANADQMLVATDHEKILRHVEDFGGVAVMTPETCQNGTERCASLLDEVEADIVINFQGDAPLIPAEFVSALIKHMEISPNTDVTTPVVTCNKQMLDALREDRKGGMVGGTTACFDRDGRALYFSKEVIPISDNIAGDGASAVFMHLGLYAYRRDALAKYASWRPGRLETIEGLEQLRFLEHGARVDCVEVELKGRAVWEVNLPEDIARVEAALKQRGIE